MLALLKLYLLLSYRSSIKQQNGLITEWKAYMRTGYYLLFLGLFLIGIVYQVVFHGEGYHRNNLYIVLAYACYVFVAVISAIAAFFKTRNNPSPTMNATALLVITDMFSTILTFETIMIDYCFAPKLMTVSSSC